MPNWIKWTRAKKPTRAERLLNETENQLIDAHLEMLYRAAIKAYLEGKRDYLQSVVRPTPSDTNIHKIK